VAYLSAQSFLFWGHKADCAVMDRVHCKASGLCWTIMYRSCKIPAIVFLNMKHTMRIIIGSPLYICADLCLCLSCNITELISYLRVWIMEAPHVEDDNWVREPAV
jgi:hypothetical protein